MKFSIPCLVLASLALLLSRKGGGAASAAKVWNRVGVFLACEQDDANCDTDAETSAETIDITPDGLTVVYSDSPSSRVGFVDITDPMSPVAGGVVDLPGEPTTVRVTPDGLFAVVGVVTSTNFVNASGLLAVISMETKAIVVELDLGGQPDSVDVSPDGNYVAVVIENERDEDLGDGEPPQLPGGKFVIVDSSDGDPTNWNATDVALVGLSGLMFPTDPEPEYVVINDNNIAVITLQENNAIVTVDLATATVLTSFSAGAVDLVGIDTVEEDVIDLTGSLSNVEREPDGVTWIGTDFFATANEGDLFGGSRSFTIFSAADNSIVYESGSMLDQLAVKYGHYQEGRSENKGAEPENAYYFEASDGTSFLVILLERSGLAVLFEVDPTDPSNPTFAQVLPTLTAPEGVRAAPAIDLLVIASEEDSRDDKLRAGVNIYQYQDSESGVPNYPSLVAANRMNGTPIPFSALSGLASAGKYFSDERFKVCMLALSATSKTFFQYAAIEFDRSGGCARPSPSLGCQGHSALLGGRFCLQDVSYFHDQHRSLPLHCGGGDAYR